MNQAVNKNAKLFWKEASKANGGKVENSNRIKDGNGRRALEEDDKDTREQVAVHIYGFGGGGV